MNSRQALVVAVFVIFGAALAVEFAGLVDHGTPTTTAAAAGDTDSTGTGEIPLKEYDERTIRNAVMGAFVLGCCMVFVRMWRDGY